MKLGVPDGTSDSVRSAFQPQFFQTMAKPVHVMLSTDYNLPDAWLPVEGELIVCGIRHSSLTAMIALGKISEVMSSTAEDFFKHVAESGFIHVAGPGALLVAPPDHVLVLINAKAHNAHGVRWHIQWSDVGIQKSFEQLEKYIQENPDQAKGTLSLVMAYMEENLDE